MAEDLKSCLWTTKAHIEQQVVGNLLLAQRRMAGTGSAKDLIRISRYLLQLAQRFHNEVMAFPKGD